MNKAIILDRDGTLNVDPGYVYKVEDFKLHEGVIEGLKLLRDFKLFIITNQSGIGRGYYKEEDMHKFNQRLLGELSRNNIKIEKIYFCPHTKEQKCDCRKPNTKFVQEAVKEFDIDIKQSWVIGDEPFDMMLAKNSSCNSVYVLTGHGQKHLKELKTKPSFIAANLLKASQYIIRNTT